MKLLTALLLCFLSAAHGAIIVELQNVTYNAGTNDYTWLYVAALQPDANMRQVATQPPAGTKPNDFFAIYDFAGYVAGSASVNSLVAQTFTLVEKNVGDNPPGVVPSDSPSLINFNVLLTGGGNIVPNATGAPLLIAELSARSIYGPTRTYIDFASQTQKKQNQTTYSSVGLVEGPTAVPEPGSMMLLGGGIGVLALGHRSYRRRREQ